jgi:hypothetical protein
MAVVRKFSLAFGRWRYPGIIAGRGLKVSTEVFREHIRSMHIMCDLFFVSQELQIWRLSETWSPCPINVAVVS